MGSMFLILSIPIVVLVKGMPTISEDAWTPFSPFNMRLKSSSMLQRNSPHHSMKFPFYMIQLYRSLLTGKKADIATLDHHVLKESDSVLGLVAKNYTKIDNDWKLSFDLSSLYASSKVRSAELRIHLPSFEKAQNVTLKIYHSQKHKEDFLGSFKMDSSQQGFTWKIFNVTTLLQAFFHRGASHRNGQFNKTKDMPDRGLEVGRTEVKTIHIDPSGSSKFPEQAILVVFAKDAPSANASSETASLIKTVKASKYVRATNVNRVDGIRRHRRNHIMFKNIPPRHNEEGKPLCRKVDMIVDFKKIGWGEYIVHPKSYNAYRCEGACPVPLNVTFQPTNHAYIKSLVHYYDPERVDCPSCVPIKLKPLSMLIYDDYDKVNLKIHEAMVVEDCGCL